MAGSHIATTPYHHSKRGWTGVGVGLCVSFSLGTCCRIWFALPIHLILIPDTLHTYIMCFRILYCGWQSSGCNPSLICWVSQSNAVVGDSRGFSLGYAVGHDWGIPSTSYSYKNKFVYMSCVSAPATAASGHKDATPTWYMLGIKVKAVFVSHMEYVLRHPIHFILIEDQVHIYNAFQHLLLRPVVIRMQP